jgi:hypothetical protein
MATLIPAIAAACVSGGGSSPGAAGIGGKTYLVDYNPGDAKITRHFDAPVDVTWNAIPLAFKDLHFAGGPSTKGNERLYMTPTLQLPGRLYEGELNSTYFECGKTPAGLPSTDSYELTFAVLVWADADRPSGSSVRILLNGWGHDRTNPSAVVQCTGTGRLEAMFLQAIEQRVKLAHAGAHG